MNILKTNNNFIKVKATDNFPKMNLTFDIELNIVYIAVLSNGYTSKEKESKINSIKNKIKELCQKN